ncbi:MAG: response regulator [Armatimonadetes bacterium]|nr:response regulator [Armatimonadota bacterium]
MQSGPREEKTRKDSLAETSSRGPSAAADSATLPLAGGTGALDLSPEEIGHELKNLLAAIVTQAELLEADLADSPQAQRARAIQAAGEMAGRLVKLLRPATAPERDEAVCSVREVVVQALTLAEALVKPSVALCPRVPAALPLAAIHPDALHQAVLNLVINAAEAIEGDGMILVQAEAAAGNIEIAIADTGPGLPGELGDRVFQPLVSGKEHGWGLGLTIVRQLVERAGGEVRVLSGAGVGTAFRLLVPEARGRHRRPSLPGSSGQPVGTGHTLLLVEDEPPVREGMKELLQRQGFTVTAAATAHEALSLAAHGDFHAVVQDLGMPDMDGFELLARLAALLPQARLVLVSGRSDDAMRQAAAQHGARVLTKPVTGRQLATTLDELLKAA